VATLEVPAMLEKPSLLKLKGLNPATRYAVTFKFIPSATRLCVNEGFSTEQQLSCEKEEETEGKEGEVALDLVTFRTTASWQTKLTLAVVSCNRYFEDEDSEFLTYFASEAHLRDGVVHMGGNICAFVLPAVFQTDLPVPFFVFFRSNLRGLSDQTL